VYTPLEVYVLPFHKYDPQVGGGVVNDVDDFLIVNVNVTVESQPAAFVPVHVFTPPVLYTVPFHSNVSQAVSDTADEVGFLIVKFNVATESQPTALPLANVFMYVPLVVYVTPFHE
jgi:hypothetical protein